MDPAYLHVPLEPLLKQVAQAARAEVRAEVGRLADSLVDSLKDSLVDSLKDSLVDSLKDSLDSALATRSDAEQAERDRFKQEIIDEIGEKLDISKRETFKKIKDAKKSVTEEIDEKIDYARDDVLKLSTDVEKINKGMKEMAKESQKFFRSHVDAPSAPCFSYLTVKMSCFSFKTTHML